MAHPTRSRRTLGSLGTLAATTLLVAAPALGQSRGARSDGARAMTVSNQSATRSQPTRSKRPPARESGTSTGRAERRAPAAPSEARAAAEPFRIWSWQAPRGDASGMETVQKFVRVKVDSVATPEAAADKTVDAILNRGLASEEVAIILQHFGMGDGGSMATGYPLPPAPALFWHWCDGLRHADPQGTDAQQACEVLGDSDATNRWWQTPWMSHGIEESRAWMDAYIARYKERQASDPRIPDPSRFHFDSENHTTPRRTWAVREFHAMKSDLRWTREAIAGFDGKTMAELYDAADGPTVDPTKGAHRHPNRQWRNWYEGVCIQAADAAMDEAAYQPIREAWPNAKSSNWRTSDAYDGVDGRSRVAVRGTVSSVNRAFGDMQAPVLYGKNPDFDRTIEGRERVMAVLRSRIESSMFSFGGPHTNFAPWTYVPGQRVSNSGQNFRIQEDQLRRTIVALRSRGINELLLWSSGDTQAGTRYWNDAADAMRDATAFDFRSANVEVGSLPSNGDVSELLALRHRDAVMIASSAASGQRHAAELRLEFRHGFGRFSSRDRIAAEVYARAAQSGVQASVGVRDRRSGELHDFGTVSMDEIFSETAREHRFELMGDAMASMLDRDGDLELVLRFEAPRPFAVEVDHATLFIADPPAERKR